MSHILETNPLHFLVSRDDQGSYTLSATTSTDVDDITDTTVGAYVDAINRVYAHGGTGNTGEWLIDKSADAEGGRDAQRREYN